MTENIMDYTDEISRPLTVKELSLDDRPREKAMKHGIGTLSDSELMAIILGTGIRGKSVITMAQELLNRYDGRLSRMSRLTIRELCNAAKGMGPAKAISLLAAIELGTRCCRDLEISNPEQITDSKSVFSIMRQRLERQNVEQFWVLYLNNANGIITSECIGHGGVSMTVVDPKVIYKSAIDLLASAIILVHNHPSGMLRPSPQDDEITRRVCAGCKVLGIRVLDHVIVTAHGFYSYNDKGHMPL